MNIHEAAAIPLSVLRGYASGVQLPKPVLQAIEQLTALLDAPAPRTAKVTPLPFAAPAGCTCALPLPVLHGDGCPLQTMDSRDTRIEELEDELAEIKADESPARIATLEIQHRAALARAVAAAQGPALVELLAALDHAIARVGYDHHNGEANVPIALWEALVEARNGYEARKPPAAESPIARAFALLADELPNTKDAQDALRRARVIVGLPPAAAEQEGA